MYRIEYIHGPRPSGVDPEDLCWQPVALEPWVDPYDLPAMRDELAEREMAGDGAYSYRIVEVTPQVVERWLGAELRWVTVESYRRLSEVA